MNEDLYVIVDDDPMEENDTNPVEEDELQEEPAADTPPIVKEEEPKIMEDGIKVRNRSKYICCANLDTRDAKGRREAMIWGPLGRDDTRILTPAQLKSREVRKLLMTKLEIRR